MRDLSGHRTALGFLYLFVHALTLLGAAVLAYATWILAHISTGRATRLPVWEGLPVQAMMGFTLFVLVLAIAGLSVGLALVRGRRVSKGTALVLSILALPSFPVGTVMGIYSLWFFGQEGWDSEPETPAWAT
ncbi:hypothetical protein D7Y13_12295 [Corallococcus praedator]|uniref:ABC transporter permease n=1 Tax=Corallococcus praedator TaxID=2316724 RepID=A0ABX9QKA1_9BACT|nr:MULTISPECIES: hypothetical protein [Corallococcus]RKH31583.1 hypothetical protein D7X75_19015 [Corallococcus sp. CA031C]RKI10674.1 hypothetical protein D7Y13_12295 [Corallococcus praedator]